MKSINNKGITLIVLVVTIVLMLLLAGISIHLTFGENGILNKSISTRDDTKKVRAQEELDIILSGYYTGKAKGTITISLSDYLSQKYGINDYIDNGDGTYTIEYNGYEFTYNKNRGVKPEFAIEQWLSADETSATVEVTITNADALKKVTSTVKDPNGNEITSTISADNAKITFTAYGNGKYKLDMEATSEIDGDELKGSNNAEIEVAGINVPIDTSYGSIEVIWVDTNNTVQGVPNSPVLSGMTPIKWDNSNNEVETNSEDTDWYSYTTGTGTADNKYSKWANAKNSDGSYFVWIPRYAYRITYYSDEAKTNVTGYYDGNGLRDVNGNLKYKLDDGIGTVTVEDNEDSYIVHPAFTNNVEQGGWDSELSGIWVAKYNISMEDENGNNITPTSADGATDKNGNETIAGDVTISNTIKAVSKPDKGVWKYITIEKCYSNGLNYDKTKNSHLIKNSEYGAVLYLSYSQYGRNGNLIGSGSNTTTGSGGADASSTGNIYGIYDLNTSFLYAWIATSNIEIENIDNNLTSTKYWTAYNTDVTEKNAKNVYKVGKIGEASKEIYIEKSLEGWFQSSIENVTINEDQIVRYYWQEVAVRRSAANNLISMFSYKIILAP